jgi:hypothetical protein
MTDIDQNAEGTVVHGLPVDFKALMEKQLQSLTKRVAPASGDKIRVGQNKMFTFPDGSTTPDPFQAVIVDFIASNDFYETGFDKNDITPPDCFARGIEPQLLVPSANSPSKQADSCAVCPNNQWGSGPNGKGKACKNSRLMALLPVDMTLESPIWLLQASPTAIQYFDKYVTALGTQLGLMPWAVVTTIGFDPSQEYPSIRFAKPERLDPSRALEFFARQEEARKRLLQEPDVSQVGAAKPATKSLRRR